MDACAAKAHLVYISARLFGLKKGIEEELVRAVGLGPVLWPEAEEYDLTLVHTGDHHRGLLLQLLLPYQPAALQEVPLSVSNDGFVVVVLS
jgi:hypothetical protein